MDTEFERNSMYEIHPLAHNRDGEIKTLAGLLSDNPIVFVWAPSGNGKTGFGREVREVFPNTVLVLARTLVSEFQYPLHEYDREITDNTRLVMFDEADIHMGKPYENDQFFQLVQANIDEGRKIVLFTHDSIKRFTQYRKYHKSREDHILRLIQNYPDAPWMYLRKWRPPKK